MYQEWKDLLFFHWEYPVHVIQETLPDGLLVDTYEEKAYLSVVAFTMKGLRPRGLPGVGTISNFLELNLRTYVKDRHGRAGVWFYSLDANSPISVEIARRFFHLPYEHACMEKNQTRDELIYRSVAKRDVDSTPFTYHVRSEEFDSVAGAIPGSLAHFWVERYHLFAHNKRKESLNMGSIRHDPYRIVEVETLEADERLMELDGFELPTTPMEKVYYSPGVAVTIIGFEKGI